MKSLKKTLVLLVVFSMILSTLVPAFAFDDVAGLDCEDQVTRMVALGIIEGFAEDGTFRPDETVTRAQMAVIIGKMVGITAGQAEANKNVASKFSDVAATHWANGWINLASNNGIISGYPDGTFRPEQTLTLNEVLTLCVKALGRGGYVDKMGTWPANYVTEAARLNLLKDVKSASDANRGTVAVIAWNTLNAPTWYVTSESLDGEVSLGSGENSKNLLAINFDEYTSKDELKELKELSVTNVPSTNKVLGDRQIEVTSKTNLPEYIEDEPSKNEEEATYYTTTTKAFVYVPEEVCEDLNTLFGRKVTILFGDDNVAALVDVTEDVVNNEFLTKYASATEAKDSKVTIGGENYKFASKVTIYVNNDKKVDEVTDGHVAFFETDSTGLLAILGEKDNKDFTKAVKANIELNSKGKIQRLDLTIAGFEGSTEHIVGKIRKGDIYDYNGTTKITCLEDFDDEDAELPRIYMDNELISAADIEVGDVLTIVGDAVYVSRNVVSGEISRIKNDVKITVDGEVYTPSNATASLYTNDELEDAVLLTSAKLEKLVDEAVEVYLNVFGEYVLVSSEVVADELEFAIVKDILSVKYDDEADIYSQKVRVVTPDGQEVTYKVVYDADDYDKYVLDGSNEVTTAGTKGYIEPESGKPADEKYDSLLVDRFNELSVGDTATYMDTITAGSVIAFEADANNEIKVEDIFVATSTSDYDVTSDTTATGNYDDEILTVDSKNFRVNGAKIVNNTEFETSTWKKLINTSNTVAELATSGKITVITEKDSSRALFIFVDFKDDVVSGAKYAYVVESGYTGDVDGKTEKMANLLSEGNETFEIAQNGKTFVEGSIVSYDVKGDYANSSTELVKDAVALNSLALTEKFAKYIGTSVLAAKSGDLANAEKEALVVKEVYGRWISYVDNDSLTIKLQDVAAEDADEVVVIDVSGEEPTFTTFDAIEAGDLVIPFGNAIDSVDLFVIIAD